MKVKRHFMIRLEWAMNKKDFKKDFLGPLIVGAIISAIFVLVAIIFLVTI